MDLFKKLTAQEEMQFRKYAQENNPPDLNDWEIYHPICREEWIKRGIQPSDSQKEN